MKTQSLILRVLMQVAVSLIFAGSPSAADKSPNVIIILADDK